MKSPAFLLYANDFLSGTAFMSAEEVGGYIRLLCYSWGSGALPNDDRVLLRLAGCSPEALAAVRAKFVIGADGKLTNARLEAVRAEREAYRQKQQNNARKRWENRGTTQSDAVAIPPDMPGGMPKCVPDACSSLSFSSSESVFEHLAPELAQGELVDLPASKPKPKKRNPAFDALAALDGLGESINSREGGRIAKALKIIRESTPHVTPDEIAARADAYARKFPKPPSAQALASHWNEFANAVDPALDPNAGLPWAKKAFA